MNAMEMFSAVEILGLVGTGLLTAMYLLLEY